MTCPLCGHVFTEYQEVCRNCPLHKSCSLICCPNCHYQFPPESRWITRLRSILRRKDTNDPAGH